MQGLELAIFMQFFLGLVAAVNPIGIMPVFVSLTAHMPPEERNRTALQANIAVAVILIVSLVAGQMLLDMFSISLDSFRVAGGLLLLSIAFSMMSGKLGEDKQNKQEKSEYISKEQIGVRSSGCGTPARRSRSANRRDGRSRCRCRRRPGAAATRHR